VSDHGASISFDRVASIYEESRGGLRRGRAYAANVAPLLGAGLVLEIGVGTATVALPLTELGRDVLGLDLSPNMLRFAHDRLGNRVAAADVMALPIADASVPNVLAVWVLQLVGSVDETLREIRRVLNDGGRFVTVLSRGRFDPDDMSEVAVDFQSAVRGGERQDAAERVAAIAAMCGLRLVDSLLADKQEFDQSPNEAAADIEARSFGILFDLDDASWQRHVVPVIAALRALPEPDRPRHRASSHEILVFDAV